VSIGTTKLVSVLACGHFCFKLAAYVASKLGSWLFVPLKLYNLSLKEVQCERPMVCPPVNMQ
jgi:hypothetical protein